MAFEYRGVQCKTCARIFATILSTGLVPAVASNAQDCSTCQQFGALHDAVQSANEDWAEMEPKRDSLKAKQVARTQYMQLHMYLDNWLMGVEASPDCFEQPRAELYDAGESRPEKLATMSGDKGQQQGIKRMRSNSPPSHKPEGRAVRQGPSGPQAQQQQGLTPSLRSSPKRSRSTNSLPERKRLNFSDSVEFRADHRGSSEYLRTDEQYVRGRYAPPEGTEWWDTSGSSQTFLKFTGVRKVKGEWVELPEAGESERKDEKAAADIRKLGESNAANTHEEVGGDPSDDPVNNAGVQLDDRAKRLAQRTRGLSSIYTTRGRNSAKSQSNGVDQKVVKPSLDRVAAHVNETSSKVPLAPPAW